MKLASFMNQRLEELLGAWDEAAAHIYPGVDGLSPKALRNSAREILLAVVEDLSAQPLAGDDERLRARGQLPAHAPSMTETARSHAAERFSQGFTVNNVVAEFCALRESVISRWIAVSTPTTADELADLRRFDHAIDQALAASVRCFDERAQEARDLLAGALAHDLRTPVGAIAVSAQVLLASVNLSAEQLRACALVLNSSHRMASMISTLLDFTRARMGPGLPISVRPADLALISEATVEECRARYPGAVIEVRRVGDLSGRWDPDRLEQVIGNLTENAVQHGGGDSPILVTVEDHGNDVCISVSNEGIIAAEERASIFDPLRRAALMKSSRSGGLGLGLYIVREICHMHGGSISVESEEDKGTTFTVKLPRFSEADQP